MSSDFGGKKAAPFGKKNAEGGAVAKGRKLSDLSDEQLQALITKAKGKAKGEGGADARRSAQLMVKLRAEQKRRRGDDDADKGKPPWLRKGKTKDTAHPRGQAVELSQRADQVVAALGLVEEVTG